MAVIAVLAGLAVPAGSATTKHYSLKLTITGKGVVHVGKARRSCVSVCHFTIKLGKSKHLRLSAVPASGWKFTAWRGCSPATTSTCSLRLPHRGSVRVTFAAPGSQLNPVPVGTSAVIPKGANPSQWTMRVLGVHTDYPWFMVKIEASNPTDTTLPSRWGLANWSFVGLATPAGKIFHWTYNYGCDGNPPSAFFLCQEDLASGDTVTGYLVYKPDNSNATEPALIVLPATQYPPPPPNLNPAPQPLPRGTIWFALPKA